MPNVGRNGIQLVLRKAAARVGEASAWFRGSVRCHRPSSNGNRTRNTAEGAMDRVHKRALYMEERRIWIINSAVFLSAAEPLPSESPSSTGLANRSRD